MNVNIHDRRLCSLDPQRAFRVSSGVSRRLETTLHRLRLGVAYTPQFLCRIGQNICGNCTSCEVEGSIEHILCQCVEFEKERQTLQETLQKIDSRPFSAFKVLGSWDTTEQFMKATEALIRFLKNTGPSDRL